MQADDSCILQFKSAERVWPEGLDGEMNVTIGFTADFELGKVKRASLKLAASSLYRAFCNGIFAGYGPARAPHGHARVDQINLCPFLQSGTNRVAIEVVGYQVNSFYVINELPFLQAEIECEEKIVAATLGEGVSFLARQLTHRVQKVDSSSF